jgi:hypothetical protein
MIIILLLLLLLSLLLFYNTKSKNTKEGLDSNNNTNNNNIIADIKKLVLQSQAELASISSEVNNLVTLEKILPQTTTGIAALTPQVDALAPLAQKVKDLSSIISHNTSLLNNVGKKIQQRGLNAAAPDMKNHSPPPNPAGRGSDWPPPKGSPPTLHAGVPKITI